MLPLRARLLGCLAGSSNSSMLPMGNSRATAISHSSRRRKLTSSNKRMEMAISSRMPAIIVHPAVCAPPLRALAGALAEAAARLHHGAMTTTTRLRRRGGGNEKRVRSARIPYLPQGHQWERGEDRQVLARKLECMAASRRGSQPVDLLAAVLRGALAVHLRTLVEGLRSRTAAVQAQAEL